MNRTAYIQKVQTTNDRNGNPRRAYVVSIPGQDARQNGLRHTRTIAAYDVRYTGQAFRSALAELMADACGSLVCLPTMNVTVDEYQGLRDNHEGDAMKAEPKDAAFAVVLSIKGHQEAEA